MRHISSRIAVLLAIAVIFTAPTASASGKPINTSIDGKSVLLARRPDPGFLYMTSGGSLAAATAALGPLHDMRPGYEMKDAGRRRASADGIDDPAISLGTVLLTDLVNSYKLQLQDSNAVIVSIDKELEVFVFFLKVGVANRRAIGERKPQKSGRGQAKQPGQVPAGHGSHSFSKCCRRETGQAVSNRETTV